MLKSVSTGQYRPLPLLQFFIPKKGGGWRRLSVPTVRDRIVQQALLQVLHPVMEREFEPSSFAYRLGRSHQMAVRQVATWHQRGYDWVLDADLFQYFDNVQHQRLLAEVKERLNHPLVLSLVEAWLNAGVLTKQGLVLPEKGLPQGAVISPILANVYLDDFDEFMAASSLKLVRYADDFLVMARTQQQLVQTQEEIAQVLESMGLQLHPDKTQITNFERGFRFLGQAFAGDLIVPISKPIEPAKAFLVEANSLRLVHADPDIKPTTMELALVQALKETHQPIPPPLFVVLGYAVRERKPVEIESDEFVWRDGMSTLYLVKELHFARSKGGLLFSRPRNKRLKFPSEKWSVYWFSGIFSYLQVRCQRVWMLRYP